MGADNCEEAGMVLHGQCVIESTRKRYLFLVHKHILKENFVYEQP